MCEADQMSATSPSPEPPSDSREPPIGQETPEDAENSERRGRPRILRMAVVTAAIFSLGACGFVPSDPMLNDIVVHERRGGVEYAVAMCQGERPLRARLTIGSDLPGPKQKLLWSNEFRRGSTDELAIARVPREALKGVASKEQLLFQLDSQLSNGDRRTAEVQWRLNELEELDANKWQDDIDEYVSSEQLHAAECSRDSK